MAGGASTDNVRIVSRNVTVNGTVFLVSVLEVCATDTTYSKTYRCSADNGVAGDAIASSSAEFSVTVLTGLRFTHQYADKHALIEINFLYP